MITERDKLLEKLHKRIEFLKSQGADFEVKRGLYGFEITHYRKQFGGRMSVSTEFITE